MNRDVKWCVVILVVLCVIGACSCRLWLSTYADVAAISFLPVLQEPFYESVLTFWTFVIIFQVMIPLSLYVTIEMAKVGQVYHIGHDPALHDTETGRKAECRALNITEELGQVSTRRFILNEFAWRTECFMHDRHCGNSISPRENEIENCMNISQSSMKYIYAF